MDAAVDGDIAAVRKCVDTGISAGTVHTCLLLCDRRLT